MELVVGGQREIIKKSLALISSVERKRATLLMGMTVVMALLDMLGVASILPFMAVLANPGLVQTNDILNAAFVRSHYVGVESVDEFFLALGALVFVVLVMSLAFKAFTTYVQTRFLRMLEYSIGRRLMEGYMHQPYAWFLNRHSADLGKNILSEVSIVVGSCLTPLMTLVTQGSVTLALLIMLLAIQPILAISVGAVLAIAYSIIFAMMSGWLKRLGRARIQANEERFKAISEAFGAAKEIKIGGLEQIYVNRFAKPAETYAKGQAAASVIGQLPRFALEATAFGGMLLVILYLMASSGGFASALPIASLYAFTGYRVLPALQQMYGAVTQLRFSGPALDTVYRDLNSLQALPFERSLKSQMRVTQAIELKRVTYIYPGASQKALSGIDLKIQAHSCVGLVGVTGSGKTTLVDVILGLLAPKDGALIVDGEPITSHNRAQWQRLIGYVPQQIFLTDDSVAANIAFGVPPRDIDQTKVERAANAASLHEFISTELPQGYATRVGERGVRLSGGQRQRIGIARALYHDPKVLVLDEATSALDNLTEKAVMAAVNNLDGKMTIIIIAHRLETVRRCGCIYLLERGIVKSSGSYEELLIKSREFSLLANK